jgi:hypothetical protein
VSYDFEKQVRIVQSMRQEIHKLDFSFFMNRKDEIVSIVLAIAVIYFISACYRKFHRVKPEHRLLKAFLACLARAGYQRVPAEGLTALVDRISQRSLQQNAGKFVDLYHRCYYRDGHFDKKTLHELKQIVHKMKEIQSEIR